MTTTAIGLVMKCSWLSALPSKADCGKWIFWHGIRAMEFFARIGSEEFAVLLPETNLEQAAIVAERLRLAVADLVIPIQTLQLQCTLSIGLTILNAADNGFSECLRRAD